MHKQEHVSGEIIAKANQCVKKRQIKQESFKGKLRMGAEEMRFLLT